MGITTETLQRFRCSDGTSKDTLEEATSYEAGLQHTARISAYVAQRTTGVGDNKRGLTDKAKTSLVNSLLDYERWSAAHPEEIEPEIEEQHFPRRTPPPVA